MQNIKSAEGLKDVSPLRFFFIWFCWLVLVGIASIIILESKEWNIEDPEILFHIGFSGILLALLIELKYTGIKIFSYVKPNQKKEWNYLLFFVPLIIISLGFSWLLDLFLYYIAPSFLENRYLWIENNPVFDPNGGILHIVIIFVAACIIAPLWEEFLFRGIILQKIMNKWTTLAGILISSLIFGIFHFDLLGALLFGIVLCLLFLETESLFVPIGIHFLNNFTALIFSFIWPYEYTGLGYLFEDMWLSILFLIISSVWLSWFIRSRLYLLKRYPS